MATIPVFSPTVPFLGLIPGGLRHGSMVRIKGIINNHGERCQINLQTGAALNPRDDVTLHISIRPNEAVIVRNTLQNQVWGAEERYGGCPIHYGQSFDVLVLVEVNQYKIAINGTHFCTFNHRLPVHSARYVSISGSCVIHSITTEMDTVGTAVPYPGAVSAHPPPYTPPSYPPHSSTGSHIGFVPVAPPMPPPPPPYTPRPSYPVGSTGLYPGAPPYIPQYGGYPHQPSYPAATPYSQTIPTAPSSTMASTMQATPAFPMNQTKTVKDSVISGVQHTKNFLHDAIYGKTTTTPSYPAQPSMQQSPSSQPPYPSQTAFPSQQTYGTYNPSVPYPPSSATQQNNNSQKTSGGLLPSGAGMATAALATGAAAAVLHKLPKKAKKSKKLMKYAAGAGILGLGGYAIGKGFRKRGSSSSSSSSDSD